MLWSCAVAYIMPDAHACPCLVLLQEAAWQMAAATGTLETLRELQALVRSKEARLEQVPVEDTELRVEIRQDLLALRDLEVWVMHTGAAGRHTTAGCCVASACGKSVCLADTQALHAYLRHARTGSLGCCSNSSRMACPQGDKRNNPLSSFGM